MADISKGSKFPEFVVGDDAGNEFQSSEFANLVVFIYPKANTPGCTKQAEGFRDSYAAFQEKRFEVVGISKDKEAAQTAWKKKLNLPFRLLCDVDGKVISLLGCGKGNSTVRSVFVVKDGEVALVKRSAAPAESVKIALEEVNGGAAKAIKLPSDEPQEPKEPKEDPTSSEAAEAPSKTRKRTTKAPAVAKQAAAPAPAKRGRSKSKPATAKSRAGSKQTKKSGTEAPASPKRAKTSRTRSVTPSAASKQSVRAAPEKKTSAKAQAKASPRASSRKPKASAKSRDASQPATGRKRT